MTQNLQQQLPALTTETLTPIVRKSTGRDTAKILDWKVDILHGASPNSGIFRFAGNALDQDINLPWSLILKIVQPTEDADNSVSLRYWKREALAYHSGLLDNLPGKIRAPRRYEIAEQPDRAVWLWLEEVADDTKGKWSLEQYGDVARHLGEFNGIFFGIKSAFSHPWMTKNQLRSWVGTDAPILPPSILSHPLVVRWIPDDIYQWIQGVWSEHLTWLDFIERQPQTLSHLDVFRRNAFVRHTSQGDLQTLLIDWAFTGSATPGEEIATLVAGSLNFLEFDSARAHELDNVVFEGYLEGLYLRGWRGDPRIVRFAYTAGSILKFSIGVSGVAYMIADENQHPLLEQMFGHPLDELVDTWGSTTRFLRELSTEARQLVSQLF